jgi:hypothetical protein
MFTSVPSRDSYIGRTSGSEVCRDRVGCLTRCTLAREDRIVSDKFESIADDSSGPAAFRRSLVSLYHVLRALCTSNEDVDYICDLNSRADDADEKRVVNRDAGAVLMPRQLLRDDVDASFLESGRTSIGSPTQPSVG